MGKTQFLVAALLAVLLVLSCAPQIAPAAAPSKAAPAPAPAAAPSVAAPTAAAKPAWQAEWEQVLEAAKKEGILRASASAGEFRAPWVAAMKSYGISLEMLIGRGSEVAEKVLTERRAGIYEVDFHGGGSSSPLTSLKPKGALEPADAALILPEVKDPKAWYQGAVPFIDKDHTVIAYSAMVYPMVAINTNLVKPGEIKSWNGLLNPKWQEKMTLLDPTKSGNGGIFVGVIGDHIMSWDYLRKLATLKPVILQDDRQRLEWLAHGKVAIVLNPQPAELTTFRKVGAPIAVVSPEEGGYVSCGSGSLSLYSRSSHPNATKVFINWLLSKEGQTITAEASGSQSARVDVPTDFLDPMTVRDPKGKYFLKDTEEFLLKQPEHFKIAKEIFKDVLK